MGHILRKKTIVSAAFGLIIAAAAIMGHPVTVRAGIGMHGVSSMKTPAPDVLSVQPVQPGAAMPDADVQAVQPKAAMPDADVQAVQPEAARPDADAPVSLKVHFEDAGTPVEGVQLKFYKLAVFDQDGGLVPEQRFSGYSVTDVIDRMGMTSAALTLEGYVGMDMLEPDHTATTSAEGVAEVTEGISQGLYLMIGGIREQGENRYMPAPAIISLPTFDEAQGRWLNDVEVTAKYTVESSSIKEKNRTAIKIWVDDEDKEGQRPDNVEIVLIEDDSSIESTINLSLDNDWRHEWRGLDASHKWTVSERQVLRYIAGVEQKEDIFSITNIYGGGDGPSHVNPPLETTEAAETTDAEPASEPPQTGETPEPDSQSTEPGTGYAGSMESPTDPGSGMLPKTGQLWWPVFVLLVAGVCFILIGLSRRR
jgi:hypothetical protein